VYHLLSVSLDCPFLISPLVGGLMSYLHYLCSLGSSLPPVVCRRDHALFTLFVFFGSSSPPVVCRRVMSYLHYLCLPGSSLPLVVNTNNVNKT
jgi:ABC-type sulfate transport system permease subunit